MNIHIIADSACDLPVSFLNDQGVSFIPLRVHLGEKDYEDQLTIKPKEVYDYMRAGNVAKTSQASPETITNQFEKLVKDNQPALYIAFSSELSGTYQTAVMVQQQLLEKYPNWKLQIIDSKCASLGYGLAVRYTIQLAKQGLDLEQMANAVKEYCSHMEHIFTVDRLEYLARGGRISKTSAFVGGLLNIKPLLHVEEGKLIPLEKIRGKKKLYRRILELMEERGDGLSEQTIAISHGDDEEAALELKQLIEETFHPKEIIIHTIGAVIGAHSGPGTLAVFFLNKHIQEASWKS
ncbi:MULTISPECIES: DegV family protein [unclassified Aeribacillus]|uniref:DegV family protein n=1 Tax=unclassified Aeribacillus TaxID=2640495 RepID=UPI0030CEF285